MSERLGGLDGGGAFLVCGDTLMLSVSAHQFDGPPPGLSLVVA